MFVLCFVVIFDFFRLFFVKNFFVIVFYDCVLWFELLIGL